MASRVPKVLFLCSCALLITATGVAEATSAEAGKGKNKGKKANRYEREEVQSYASPSIGGGAAGREAYFCVARPPDEPDNNIGCMIFRSEVTDRFVSIDVVDASGLPVPVQVTNSATDDIVDFCGEIDEPLAIEPGAELAVRVAPQDIEGGCEGAASRGEVTLTFSNYP